MPKQIIRVVCLIERKGQMDVADTEGSHSPIHKHTYTRGHPMHIPARSLFSTSAALLCLILKKTDRQLVFGVKYRDKASEEKQVFFACPDAAEKKKWVCSHHTQSYTQINESFMRVPDAAEKITRIHTYSRTHAFTRAHTRHFPHFKKKNT